MGGGEWGWEMRAHATSLFSPLPVCHCAGPSLASGAAQLWGGGLQDTRNLGFLGCWVTMGGSLSLVGQDR